MISELLFSLHETTWLLLALVFVTSLWLTKGSNQNKDVKLPPTPGIALPFIGHAYISTKLEPMKRFREFRKRLGDIFLMQMGTSTTLVVLSGYETIKHVLLKEADKISDRPPNPIDYFTDTKNNLGVLRSSGHNWKEQRTTSLQILRNFGMGKNSLGEKIAEEVEKYVSEISKCSGKPTDQRTLTNMCVSNVICNIIFGRGYDLQDEEFQRLMHMQNQLTSLLSPTSVIFFMPWLGKLPFDPFNVKAILEPTADIRKFSNAVVDRKLKEYDPDTMSSFTAAYLKEMDKKTADGASTNLDHENLYQVVEQLFIAGTETTATTICWCQLYMLYYPEVQEKIYQEILENVGTDRVPTLSDKTKLRYLNATISEITRMANILPFSVQHYTNAPIQVKGYTIPANANVIVSLDSILTDENIWGDPQNFRPERFLDADGNLIKRDELTPFSIGRRICLGEALAKMELFLFLSAMFQRFKILPEDTKNLPSLEANVGVTRAPKPFKMRLVERK